MKWAKILSLGGQLISADAAGYDDYKNILVCPECNEAVFLRGASIRHIKTGDRVQESRVPAHFVHHAFIEGRTRTCSQRVGEYDEAAIERKQSEARNQRAKLLEFYLWKYLKKNAGLRSAQFFSEAPALLKRSRKARDVPWDYIVEPFLGMCAQDGHTERFVAPFLHECDRTISDLADFGDRIVTLMQSPSENEEFRRISHFYKVVSRDWEMQQRISREVMRFLLGSKTQAENRARLFVALMHPKWMPKSDRETIAKSLSDLAHEVQKNGQKKTSEQELFTLLITSVAKYFARELSAIVTTVPWLEVMRK